MSSSYAAAAYLKSVGFKKKVLLIGPQGLEDEIKLRGIDYINSNDLHLPVYNSVEDMLAIKVDPDIGAVVVGW